MIHTYRCYLMDAHCHIQRVEVIECTDDAVAKQKAEQILAAHPHSGGVEVWEWDRRVHVQLSIDAIGVP